MILCMKEPLNAPRFYMSKKEKRKKKKKKKEQKKNIYIYIHICKKVDRKPERAVHAKGEPKEGRV